MKKTLLILPLLALLFSFSRGYAQTSEPDGKAIMLFGASFAVPENGWFEMGCRKLGYEPINKAVGGEAIYNDARRMAAGTDYTVEELDRTELLVIMHAHNKNVANEENLKDSWEDYTNITTSTDYAVAYDYVIKRYMADCAALEFNENSIYYNVPGGKPAHIMLCTHWHDGRVEYNESIRKLADKWNFPLVEFDTRIGFSKEDNQEDKGAPSLEFCADKETLYGVTFGWHPQRGSNREIQQRMAAIFIGTVAEYLEQELPFEVSTTPLSPVYQKGEYPKFMVEYSGGMFPYTLNTKEGETETSASRHLVGTDFVSEPTFMDFTAGAVSFGGETVSASVSSPVLVAEYTAIPDYDSYTSYAQSGTSFDSSAVLQLKNKANSGRKIYVSFPVSEDMPSDAKKIVLRLFLTKFTIDPDSPTYPRDGYETLRVEGNTAVYNNLTWGNTNNQNHEQSWQDGQIASTTLISSDMVGSWIGIDVTDWVNETRQKLYGTHNNYNTGHLTFRLTLNPDVWYSLFEFCSSEGALSAASTKSDAEPAGPQLLFANYDDDFLTGTKEIASDSTWVVEGGKVYNSGNERIGVFNADGRCAYSGSDSVIDLSGLAHGVYIIRSESNSQKICR